MHYIVKVHSINFSCFQPQLNHFQNFLTFSLQTMADNRWVKSLDSRQSKKDGMIEEATQ